MPSRCIISLKIGLKVPILIEKHQQVALLAGDLLNYPKVLEEITRIRSISLEK
jgi:hypothetical protein